MRQWTDAAATGQKSAGASRAAIRPLSAAFALREPDLTKILDRGRRGALRPTASACPSARFGNIRAEKNNDLYRRRRFMAGGMEVIGHVSVFVAPIMRSSQGRAFAATGETSVRGVICKTGIVADLPPFYAAHGIVSIIDGPSFKDDGDQPYGILEIGADRARAITTRTTSISSPVFGRRPGRRPSRLPPGGQRLARSASTNLKAPYRGEKGAPAVRRKNVADLQLRQAQKMAGGGWSIDRRPIAHDLKQHSDGHYRNDRNPGGKGRSADRPGNCLSITRNDRPRPGARGADLDPGGLLAFAPQSSRCSRARSTSMHW